MYKLEQKPESDELGGDHMARVLGLCAAAAVIVLLVGCSGGNDTVVTPSGVKYVFVNDPSPGLLHLFEVIGTTVTQLTTGTTTWEKEPSVSWDRTKCAFTLASLGGEAIYIVSLPSGTPQMISDGPNDFNPTISPDGRFIAFSRGTSPARLWLMLSDGRSPRPIGPGTGNEIEPQFSADGRAVYYASNAAGNYNIYRVDTLSGGVTQITNDPTDERHPTLRGAYEDLIYSGNATGSWRLYYKDATLPDSTPVKLTNGPGDDVEPCWPHPENTSILFTNINSGAYTIKSLEIFPLLTHTPITQQPAQ
jgi:Tol biopolymer transport system component